MSVTADQRILVVGGTGFLGKPVADGLRAAGHPVRILARSPEKARSMFGEDIDVKQGDVTQPESLPLAMEGCYGVHVSLHGHQGTENFFRVEHRGVENVARAAAEAGVKHITMVSGANVCRDEDVYFVKAKYLGEQALLDGEVPATILRCSWFMESLPLMVRGLLAVIVGNQPHPVHFIALKDLAGMVVKVYATPEAGDKVMAAYGPETWTVHDALEAYCQVFAPWAPLVHMPLWMFWIVSRIGGGRLPLLHDLMKLLNEHPEPTDCGDAAGLLGPNTTTLGQWLVEGRGTE